MTHRQPSDFDTRFAMIDDDETATSASARHIEARLQVCLPADFGRICEFLDGCDAGGWSGVRGTPSHPQDGIVELTVECRRDLELPQPYVVLGADDETILLLACAGAVHGEDGVHLVPRTDLVHFCAGARPGNSRSWPTFVEYLAEVLESDTDAP